MLTPYPYLYIIISGTAASKTSDDPTQKVAELSLHPPHGTTAAKTKTGPPPTPLTRRAVVQGVQSGMMTIVAAGAVMIRSAARMTIRCTGPFPSHLGVGFFS